MSMYVTDTHAMVFYANRNQRQLSRRAWQAFEEAENWTSGDPSPRTSIVGSFYLRTHGPDQAQQIL